MDYDKKSISYWIFSPTQWGEEMLPVIIIGENNLNSISYADRTVLMAAIEIKLLEILSMDSWEIWPTANCNKTGRMVVIVSNRFQTGRRLLSLATGVRQSVWLLSLATGVRIKELHNSVYIQENSAELRCNINIYILWMPNGRRTPIIINIRN